MFPIPAFMILVDGTIVPLPPGGVKKVITLDYPDNSGNTNNSLAILLNDGRLFMQGSNLYGEIADGTRASKFSAFVLSATTAADIFTGDRCFVLKHNDGTWQYAGSSAGLYGSWGAGGTDVVATTWTDLPSYITAVIDPTTLASVKGGFNNTLWLTTTRVLYGTGENQVGSLGSGDSNPTATPFLIASNVSTYSAGYNQCSYIDIQTKKLRVCGQSRGLAGNNDTTTSYVDALVVNSSVNVFDYLHTISQTLIVGAELSDGKVNIYSRSGTDTVYTPVAGLQGLNGWTKFPGEQSSFMALNFHVYSFGKNYTANLGVGYDSPSDGPFIAAYPSTTHDIPSWEQNKVKYVESVDFDVTDQLGHNGTFMVYDGNIFYSGITKDGKANYFFNSTLSSNVFGFLQESLFEGVKALGVTTDSLGICLVGATKQLTYMVDPDGAALYNIKYTTSDATKMTVNASGLMTFVAEGGFDAGMSAWNNEGTLLSDSSGGYASTLTVYTDSLNAMVEGDTQQLVATITPTDAEYLPDMVITYTTTDATVATVDSNGLITAVGSGDCRIGCTATYQSTVVASDSSHLDVASVVVPAGDIQQIAVATRRNGNFAMSSLAILRTNGDLYTQGENLAGECATGDKVTYYNAMRKVATGVSRVFGGEQTFIIQKTDGSWLYSGNSQNAFGGGASNVTAWTAIPTNITSVVNMASIKDVSSSTGSSLWLQNNGVLYGVGGNTNGQIGNNTVTQVSTPRLMSNSTQRIEARGSSTAFIEGSTGAARQSGFKGTYDACCEEVHSHYTISVPGGYIVDFSGGVTGGSGNSHTNSLVLRKATQADTVISAAFRAVSSVSAVGWNYAYSGAAWTTISLVKGSAGHYAMVDGVLKKGAVITGSTFTFNVEPAVTQFGPWDVSKIGPIYAGNMDSSSVLGGEISMYNGSLMYKGSVKFFGLNAAGSPANFTYIDPSQIVYVDA